MREERRSGGSQTKTPAQPFPALLALRPRGFPAAGVVTRYWATQ
jgi:hypothetical protein